jgi:hypothetical protein
MNAVGTSMAVVSRPAGVFSATSNRSTITTLASYARSHAIFLSAS